MAPIPVKLPRISSSGWAMQPGCGAEPGKSRGSGQCAWPRSISQRWGRLGVKRMVKMARVV